VYAQAAPDGAMTVERVSVGKNGFVSPI
jgi:hypothetical protein